MARSGFTPPSRAGIDHHRRRRVDRHARCLAPGVQADTGGLVTLNGANSFHQRRWVDRTLRPGRRRHRRDRATTISTGNTSTSTGLNAYGVNADGAGSQIDLARDDRHDVVDERLWVLRQRRRDDLRGGRAEHNHVRKWLDRPLRFRRRVDHHRRWRVDRHSRRLGAGRAGRHRRARDAERRLGDDDGDRRARGVRKRGRARS